MRGKEAFIIFFKCIGVLHILIETCGAESWSCSNICGYNYGNPLSMVKLYSCLDMEVILILMSAAEAVAMLEVAPFWIICLGRTESLPISKFFQWQILAIRESLLHGLLEKFEHIWCEASFESLLRNNDQYKIGHATVEMAHLHINWNLESF